MYKLCGNCEYCKANSNLADDICCDNPDSDYYCCHTDEEDTCDAFTEKVVDSNNKL